MLEYLNEEYISKKFNKYRKIRNDINYYEKTIEKETVIKAKEEIPKLIKQLEKYLQ